MTGLLIFIADSQPISRAGIATIISGSIDPRPSLEQFSRKEELFIRLQSVKPDVLIIDDTLFDPAAINYLAEIKKNAPKPGIIVVTTDQPQEQIYAILDRGINCCIMKSCEQQELTDAVNAAADNRKYFCNRVLNILLARKTVKRRNQPNSDRLTPAEQEIVRMIAQGLTSKEIAERKKLSYHTIITHRKNIFRKLAIKNSTELMLHAMNTGMIEAIDYSI